MQMIKLVFEREKHTLGHQPSANRYHLYVLTIYIYILKESRITTTERPQNYLVTLSLRISQRAVERSRYVDMEQRPVQPLNNRYPAPLPSITSLHMSVRLAVFQLLCYATGLRTVTRFWMCCLDIVTSYLR